MVYDKIFTVGVTVVILIKKSRNPLEIYEYFIIKPKNSLIIPSVLKILIIISLQQLRIYILTDVITGHFFSSLNYTFGDNK